MRWGENLSEETAALSGQGLLSGTKPFAFKALQGAENRGASCRGATRRAGCNNRFQLLGSRSTMLCRVKPLEQTPSCGCRFSPERMRNLLPCRSYMHQVAPGEMGGQDASVGHVRVLGPVGQNASAHGTLRWGG